MGGALGPFPPIPWISLASEALTELRCEFLWRDKRKGRIPMSIPGARVTPPKLSGHSPILLSRVSAGREAKINARHSQPAFSQIQTPKRVDGGRKTLTNPCGQVP